MSTADKLFVVSSLTVAGLCSETAAGYLEYITPGGEWIIINTGSRVPLNVTK